MERELTKAERTRQFIIEACAVVFNKKGFSGTSLNDLIEATGLTKGSIYGNFENKEEVAIAVFDHNWMNVCQNVEKHIALGNTPKEKLLLYTEAYRKISKAALAAGGCPLMNVAIEADDTNPVLKEKASIAFQKWQKSVSKLIDKGIEAGEFRKEVNSQQAAISIIALIEGGLMMANLNNQMKYLNSVLETVDQYIESMSV